MMLFTRNPEFNRNLWIEFSWHRVLLVPVLMGLVLWALFASRDFNFRNDILIEGSFVSIAALAIWMGGAYLVAQNLYIEWERRTWDIQRLSPIRPWSLVWGKMFGSAAYTWYIGLLALLVYLLAPLAFLVQTPPIQRLEMVLLVIGTGILLQSIAFLSTLYSLRFSAASSRYVKRTPMAAVGIGFFAAMPLLRFVNQSTPIHWYGHEYAVLDFLLVTTASLAAWALYGAHRLTRSEFLYRNGPLPWLLFTLFLSALLAGFADESPAAVALFTSLGLTYLALFSAPVDTLGWHHAIGFFQRRQWRRFGETLPLWTNGVPVLLVLFVIAPVAGTTALSGKVLTPALYLSIAGFLVRDTCLLHMMHFTLKNQRAMASAVAYLMILYWLLPWLCTLMHMGDALGFFWPVPGLSPLLVWVEAAALGLWTWVRWKQYAAVAFAEPQNTATR